MHGSDPSDDDRPRARRMRLRRAAPMASALVLVAVLAAACSSGGGSDPGVAGGGSGSTTTVPSSGGAGKASGLAYSQCMRSHGVTNFPDPNSSGGISISPGSGVNPNSPQYAAATRACKSKAPSPGTPAQQQQNYDARLKYANCMQARGIDVPDPLAPGSSGGGPTSQSNSRSNASSSGANNPNSPQFIAANKACEHYLPGGSAPSLSGPGGGS
jgi:hypothetical protein